MRGERACRMPCGWSIHPVLLLLLLGALDVEAEQEVPPCPARCACYVPSEVHCTFRSLTSFPAGISRSVERVNLGYNGMTSLPVSALVGLTRLRLLLLHGNEIEEIPYGAMSDLGALQVLKLSYNRLHTLTSGSLRGAHALTRLHLDHNRLTSLDANALLGLTSLRLLTLEGNALTSLPPGGLATLNLLGGRDFWAGSPFRVSTLRHLSLAGNALTSLPPTLLLAAPLLETLSLHGNPWACNCESAAWVGKWTARIRAALRCRKDKGAEAGISCPVCAGPAHFLSRDLRDLEAGDITCATPAIYSPLRNGTRGPEGEVMADEDDVMALSNLDIGLDLADAHGNRVTLACDPSGAGPPQMTDVLAVQPQGEGARLSVEATMTLALSCEVTRDAHERAWRLLAYYSDVSVSLGAITERGSFAGDDATACYAQDPDDGEALYNTGLHVNLTTPPEWVWLRAPRLFRLRLDRKRTSARRMLLTYEARISRALPGTEGDGDVILNGTDDAIFSAGDDLTSWVAIAPDPDAGGVIAMEGEEVRLPCDVTASAPARVAWRLPGGATVTRTLAAPEDDDGERETPAPGDDAYRERTLSEPQPEEKTRTRGDDVRDAAPGAWRSHSGRILSTRSGVLRNKRSFGTPVDDISEAAPDSWRKRKRHSPTSDVTILRDGSLLLRAARPDDAGRYVCVATVGFGASQDRAVRRLLVTSSAGPLRGDDAATLQKPPGAALTLPCFVSGAAALAWELPGGRLLRRGVNTSSGAAVDGNGSLVLAPLRGGDSGFFRCLAVNQVGSDAFAVELAVVSESRGDDVGGVVTGDDGDEEAWGAEPEDLIRARPEVRTPDLGGNDGRGSNLTSRTRSRKLTAGKPEVGSADRKAETKKQQNRKSLFRRRKLNQAALEVTSLDPSLSPDRPEPHMWEQVADVRRVRVHVTNPRVSPAHWADVLARVLARNLTVAGSDVIGTVPVPAPVVAGEMDDTARGEMDVTARNAEVGGVLVQVTQNPDGISDVRDSYDVIGADIANAPNVTFTSEATGKGQVTHSYDVTNSTAANTTKFIDFYDVINTPDVIDRDGINGSHVVINGTDIIVAPNATAANISSPSAEEEEAETAEEEESAEAPSLRFSGRHDVIQAPSSSPTFRFQPDSESGFSATGDFQPLRPLQFSVWGTSSSASASGSSEQQPSRGGDFRLGPVSAFPLDLKGSRRRKRPWEFLLTTSSFTSRSGENPATPTDHITVTPLNRRGRKRLQHRNHLIPHPTSGPAGPEELQLPVPEAPPTKVTPPRRKLGKKAGRRRGTVSPLSLLWEQEVVVTHGGGLSASPAHHAWSVTSLPVTALRQGRVTEAVQNITVLSSNDAVTKTATYDVIAATNDDIMPHTTTSDAIVFSDDAVTAILTNDVTTPSDDVMGITTDVTAFLDDVMTETEHEVVHDLVSPNPVVDRTPGTATIFFKEETAGDVNRWDDIVRNDVTAENTVSATVPLTTPDAGDVTTSAMDDVIGDVVRNSTNDVIVITGVGDVIARPPTDNLSASGSAKALLTPVDVQMSISEEMTSLRPQQEVISTATITPPHLPSVVMAVSSRPVIPPFWPRIHGHLGPPAPPASRGLHRITLHDPVAVTSQGLRVIHVPRGSDLRLRCVVVGGSFPRVLWRLPSRRLLDAHASPDSRVSVALDGSLSVASVTERDAGDYVCMARNSAGDEYTAFTVHILVETDPAAPGFTSGFASRFPSRNSHMDLVVVDVRYGDTARLPCAAALALDSQSTETMWTSPARMPVLVTPSSGRYSMDAGGTLEIREARRADAGNYTCTVRTVAGDVVHSVALLRVAVLAPRIHSAVANVVVPLGGRTQIPCRAEGVPPPRVLWALPGGVVLPSPFAPWSRLAVLADGALEIRAVRASDAGLLECIARNEGGEARVAVRLTVTPEPRVVAPTTTRESVTATAGHTITLRCPGSAWLPPGSRLLWLLPDGTELVGGRGRGRFHHGVDGALHVSALTWADAGIYRCVATDASGIYVGAVALSVGSGSPDAQADDAGHLRHMSGVDAVPVVSARVGSSVRVACRGAGNSGAPVTWELPDHTQVTSLSTTSRSSRAHVDPRGWLALWPVTLKDTGLYRCWVPGSGNVARAVFVHVD